MNLAEKSALTTPSLISSKMSRRKVYACLWSRGNTKSRPGQSSRCVAYSGDGNDGGSGGGNGTIVVAAMGTMVVAAMGMMVVAAAMGQ